MYFLLRSRTLTAFFSALLLSQTIVADTPNIAPDFVLPGLRQPIKLSGFAGKVVYLDFWASWCKPCLKSFPWMDSMHEKYQQEGLVVIAINLDREQQLAKNFLTEHSPGFHVAFDQQGETPKAYRLKGMPTSFLIGRDGQILSTHVGFSESKKHHYEKIIIQALRSSTPTVLLENKGESQ